GAGAFSHRDLRAARCGRSGRRGRAALRLRRDPGAGRARRLLGAFGARRPARDAYGADVRGGRQRLLQPSRAAHRRERGDLGRSVSPGARGGARPAAPLARPERGLVKFVHAADLHLDSPLRGLPVYEGAPVDEIRGATRRACEILVELCVGEGAALLVIAGDLYDGDWRDYSTGLFFVQQMARLRDAGVQVAWVRGNHD